MIGTTNYGNNDRLTERLNRSPNPRAALAVLCAVLADYKSQSQEPCSSADFYGGNNLKLARHFLSLVHGEEVLALMGAMKKGGQEA